MTNEMDSLKCSIKIDYDIPFDFTEEREQAFESIVNSISNSLHNNIGNDKEVKLLANYTTNTNIDIYKSTNSNISKEYFKNIIKLTLGLISKTGVKVKTENGEDTYPVEFYVEFPNSDNFKIINSKKTYIKDSADNGKKDDNTDLVNVEVKFNAIMDKSFVKEFNTIIDHKMDSLIDLYSFPEIKTIYNASTKLVKIIKELDYQNK
jgi:hypothetical protein